MFHNADLLASRNHQTSSDFEQAHYDSYMTKTNVFTNERKHLSLSLSSLTSNRPEKDLLTWEEEWKDLYIESTLSPTAHWKRFQSDWSNFSSLFIEIMRDNDARIFIWIQFASKRSENTIIIFCSQSKVEISTISVISMKISLTYSAHLVRKAWEPSVEAKLS
jgi:hypothetical protein